MPDLTDRDREVLDFAGTTWRYAGAREQAIRDRFGCSAARYQLALLALLERPEALAYAPVTVKRELRKRDRARWARSSRHLR